MTTFMLYSYVGTSVIVCCKKSTRVLQSVGYTPPFGLSGSAYASSPVLEFSTIKPYYEMEQQVQVFEI